MKLAIIGGTGSMGLALAGKLAAKHKVLIGSRDPSRAKAAAAKVRRATGADYITAARECDAALIAVPFSALDSLPDLSAPLKGKLVISLVNPLNLEGRMMVYGLREGSAAQMLAAKLPKSRVATAFNNVPAGFFRMPRLPAIDVLVAADSPETFKETSAIVRSVPGLRPLYAGPLSEANVVERMTPLVLNLARHNETGSLAPRFVSQKG